MGNDVKDNVEYLLSVMESQKRTLFQLRKWSHLKMAVDKDLIWIRGFSPTEIESATVLKIPFINRYYLNDARLVPYGKYLPERVVPNVLWSPIQRGLKINLPKENFNYFGIKQTFKISLLPSKEIKSIDATIVEIDALENYLNSAYEIRLKNLQWTILEHNAALILGTPILPIRGQDLYQNGCFLIPAGWRLEFENMVKVYEQALGASNRFWYLVDIEGGFNKVRKADFIQLSWGSFINSMS